MATTDPSDPDMILAGELALGVLEGDELATAQRRLIADPEFAAAVARWRDHFAAAALRGPAEPAPDRIGARVMAAIAEPRADAAVLLRRSPMALSPIALWRATALSLGAVAAVLAALVLRPAAPPATPVPAAPVLVAAMTISADHTPLLARVEAQSLRVSGALAVPTQRDAQAWVIDGQAPPRSLGVLHRIGASALETRPERALRPGQTLAISIEPLGGAPGPLPTGPVVATGTIEAI